MISRNVDLVPNRSSGSFGLIRFLLALTIGIAVGSAVAWLLHATWSFPLTVAGDSMEPALFEGERITIERRFKAEELTLGTILYLRHPESSDYTMLRRLAALPGDRVEIVNKRIFINHSELRGDFEVTIQNELRDTPPLPANESVRDNLTPIELSRDEIFLLADNRLLGTDSRQLGPFQIDQIIGVMREK